MASLTRRAAAWLDLRLHLSDLRAYGASKTVPRHRYSFLYYLGGATLFLLVVQVVSGILLTMYYRPSESEAHASVSHLITNVPFGDLVRSVHSWAGDLLIGVLVAHLFSVWILRAYRSPREFTWVLGVVLLIITVALAFTGTLLPWSELAYSSTRVGTDIAGMTPLVGPWLEQFLRAGDVVSGLTLTRFFGLHVALLPASAFIFGLLHLVLVQAHGVSVPRALETKALPTVPFYPVAVLRDVFYWLLLLGVVVSLATFIPRDLGLQADAFAPAPANIRPAWYFLFVFQTLKLLPTEVGGIEGGVLGVAGFTLAFVFLLLLPFFDRRAKPIYPIAGWLALALFLGFTIYGWLA